MRLLYAVHLGFGFNQVCVWWRGVGGIHKFFLILNSTYTQVSNFGKDLSSKMTIRLIRGATYTRVYTVIIVYDITIKYG